MNTVTLEKGQLVIRTKYDPELVAQIKSLPKRKWDATEKAWYVSPKYSKEVQQIAHTFNIDYEVSEIPDEMITDNLVRINYEQETFYIYFDYDLVLLEKVRGISRARYSPILRGWSVPKECAVEVLEFAEGVNALIEPSCDEVLEKAQKDAVQVAASRAIQSNFVVEGIRGELMPFQKAGVEYAVNAKRCFIADEMGLGKTIQALATIHSLNAYPVLVVCPASVKINWKREVQKWLPQTKTVEVLKGRNKRRIRADIVIINYDILEAWVDKLNGFRSVIYDESHYCKNPKAKRTRAAIQIADRIDGPVLCLTGTPILNNPSELTAQLRILGRIKEFGGAMKFRERFQGTKHLNELNSKLRASMYVRRRKIDVLTELPPKRWSDVIVEPTGESLRKYKEAEKDLISFLANQAKEKAYKEGATTAEAFESALIASMKAQAAEQLVAVNTLKKLAAESKYSATVEWINNFLATGNKLIVFTWHKSIADRIVNHYGALKLTGDTTTEQRAINVDKFQNDPNCQLFVSTMKAGGVGITLTASSDVLFIEQGWTPADMDQAADRAHRIGQHDSVTAWTMIAEGTIDEDIKELINYKRGLVDASTEGKMIEDKQNVLTDLLVRLARRGYGRYS